MAGTVAPPAPGAPGPPPPPTAGPTEPVAPAWEFGFPESPRWHDGALWLSDQLAGHVLRVLGDAVDVVDEIDRPSGLGFLSDGTRRVAVIEPPRVVHVGPGTAGSGDADLSAFG